MANLEDKAVELLNKLDSLTTQYAPDVINAAANAVTVTAIGDLISGVVGLFCVYIGWWITKNFTTYAIKEINDGGYYSDWDVGMAFGLIIGFSVCTVVGMFSVFNLLDIWNWVAIFNPKLALAHRILGL